MRRHSALRWPASPPGWATWGWGAGRRWRWWRSKGYRGTTTTTTRGLISSDREQYRLSSQSGVLQSWPAYKSALHLSRVRSSSAGKGSRRFLMVLVEKMLHVRYRRVFHSLCVCTENFIFFLFSKRVVMIFLV